MIYFFNFPSVYTSTILMLSSFLTLLYLSPLWSMIFRGYPIIVFGTSISSSLGEQHRQKQWYLKYALRSDFVVTAVFVPSRCISSHILSSICLYIPSSPFITLALYAAVAVAVPGELNCSRTYC